MKQERETRAALTMQHEAQPYLSRLRQQKAKLSDTRHGTVRGVSVDMGRKVGNHLTAAGCVRRHWTQEFTTSPAHSASTIALGWLRSYRCAEKIHRESQYSTSPLSHCHQL